MDSDFPLFGQLPEPLRAAVYAETWRDKGAWQSEEERKGLRLVCRQACAAVDAELININVEVVIFSDFVRGAALGRFLGLREITASAHGSDAASALALVQVIPPRLEKLLLGFLQIDERVAAALVATGVGIRELHLEICVMGEDSLQALTQRPWYHLEVLKLWHAWDVGRQGAASLAAASTAHRLPALRELDLHGSRLGDGVQALASGAWPCLEVLILRGNNVDADGAAALAAASAAARLPKLQALDVSCNIVGDAGTQALLTTTWPCLVRLDLGYNKLGPTGAAALAAASAARLPLLTELELYSNSLAAAGVEALMQGSWSHLEVLYLNSNALGSAGAAAIGAAAAQLPALRSLGLSNSDIDGPCMQSVLQNPWPCLERLYVSGNRLYPQGAAVVAAAAQTARLPALRVLSLSNTNLASGLTALAKVVWPALEELRICSNNVSCHGVQTLVAAGRAHFPVLKRLDVFDDNWISSDEMVALQGAWPGVTIE